MKEWLTNYIQTIVSEPDQVEVSSSDGELVTVYTVKVAGSDVGRVKGRQGRMVLALQSVLGIASLKQRRRYVVDVVD